MLRGMEVVIQIEPLKLSFFEKAPLQISNTTEQYDDLHLLPALWCRKFFVDDEQDQTWCHNIGKSYNTKHNELMSNIRSRF